MSARLMLLLPLMAVALLACSPTTTPVESSEIQRGTALPPPALAMPAR